jgi:hypothetical protein
LSRREITMKSEILDRGNELNKRLSEVNSFICGYRNTWKRGILKAIKSKIFVGHLGYGWWRGAEIEADKVLSEKIYIALLEYQEGLRKEFRELGQEEGR